MSRDSKLAFHLYANGTFRAVAFIYFYFFFLLLFSIQPSFPACGVKRTDDANHDCIHNEPEACGYVYVWSTNFDNAQRARASRVINQSVCFISDLATITLPKKIRPIRRLTRTFLLKRRAEDRRWCYGWNDITDSDFFFSSSSFMLNILPSNK